MTECYVEFFPTGNSCTIASVAPAERGTPHDAPGYLRVTTRNYKSINYDAKEENHVRND